MQNPFNSSLKCPECGSIDVSKLTATYDGNEIDREDAFSFLLSNGETHALVSVECDDCGERTSRSLRNIEL